MENQKSICPNCGKSHETEIVDGITVFTKHRRHKPHSSEEDTGSHLRNITDEVCPGSGQVVAS